MKARTGYYALLGAVAIERLAELVVAQRHRRRALERGGVETGQGHYPAMVTLHTGLLLGCAVEPLLRPRRFVPALGWPAAATVVAAQGLRWWCIRTLGEQWNTRILVIPDAPLQHGGPYRWLRHPNYVAVVAEGAALPLVYSCVDTAAAFSTLNAALLRVRIRAENRALTAAG